MGWFKKTLIVLCVQALALTTVSCGEPDFDRQIDLREVTATDQETCIKGVEFIQKKPDFGGEACVAMFLRSAGVPVDQDFVFDQSGLDPLLGRGCNARELVAAVRSIGIDPGSVWQTVNADDAKTQIDKELKLNLKEDIQRGIPWVVCLQWDEGQKFVLVLGVNNEEDRIIFHDPNRESGGYLSIPTKEFSRRWLLKGNDGSEFFVKLRMDQKKEIVGNVAEGYTDADYAQHILKLKQKMPDGDFKIVIQKPFVVIGDEDLTRVKQRSTNTVGWATSKLKERYFTKDPIEILDVWLFKDKESYDRNAKTLFGRKPSTPFGYYSSFHKSLVMNISTGGGTLVHEIVHPFIESNFPDCPSWFNEGLASLYEQCSERDRKIWGSTNWRLRGLQLAIADDRVPDFETLCNTTRDQFYDQDPGTNYSQARYLCYYLQEQGKLVEFYETFRDNVGRDPSGLSSLKKVLGINDLKRFKREWQVYVSKLRYGR